MQISARTQYACTAMLDLAMSYDRGEPLQLRKIAEAHEIPSGFLVQILLQLKVAGLVISTRGAAGGYRLSRPPEEISLWDVMAVIDGERNRPCDGPRRADSIVLYQTWDDAWERSRRVLESTTYAELAEQARSTLHAMYYI